MKKDELKLRVAEAFEELRELDAVTRDAKLIAMILREADIRILPEDTFFVFTDAESVMMSTVWKHRRSLRSEYPDNAEAYRTGERLLAYTGCLDFGHTAPDWETVLTLGLPGLLKRVRDTRYDPSDIAAMRFREAQETVYGAAFEIWIGLRLALMRPETAERRRACGR